MVSCGNNLHYRISRGKEDNSLTLYEQLELAALIRTILFRAVHRDEFSTGLNSEHLEKFSGERAFREEYIGAFSLKKSLCDVVDCLKAVKGCYLDYPDETAFCLDYVMDEQLLQHCAGSHARVLAGERYLLYQCTLESIQANGQTGFQNFLYYQNRKLVQYRKRECVSGLYYYYHYGAAEGICGQQVITYEVTKGYIRLMVQAQDALGRYIEGKRIVIECNPSSNVLIGTFQRYEHHPVFRFNNRKLKDTKHEDCPQLQVCINTDDLGVFDTSLEFEYALLEQTLLEQRDETAHSEYNARDVIEYLDDLRKMGLRAVFPGNLD